MIPTHFSPCSLPRLALLVLALLVVTTLSCKSTLTIKSIPVGAEISFQDRVIGKTPSTIDYSTLTTIDDSHPGLRIDLPGYQSVYVIFPDHHSQMEINLNLENLTTDKKEGLAAVEPTYQQLKSYYQDSTKMLNEQFKVINGQDPSQEHLTQIKKKYQDAGSPYILEAMSAYKKGDVKKAEGLVEQGLLRNPWEEDFHIIEQTLKVKAQATSNPK